jgi:hypothetical protein
MECGPSVLHGVLIRVPPAGVVRPGAQGARRALAYVPAQCDVLGALALAGVEC